MTLSMAAQVGIRFMVAMALTLSMVVRVRDTIYGGIGDDTIIDNRGMDVIDGGEGIDTVEFGGSQGSYTFTLGAGGELNVIHADLTAQDYLNTDTNEAPVARDDELSGQGGSLLTIAAEILTTNDTDADDLTLTIDNVGNALHGTVSMDDAGAILFAPDVGLVGQSSFDYTISDPNGAVSSATVTIDVGAAQYPDTVPFIAIADGASLLFPANGLEHPITIAGPVAGSGSSGISPSQVAPSSEFGSISDYEFTPLTNADLTSASTEAQYLFVDYAEYQNNYNSNAGKWGGDIGTGAELTYSFAEQESYYWDPVYGVDPISGANYSVVADLSNIIDFTSTEETLVRNALDRWSDFSGLSFTEVSDTQNVSELADIRLAKLDFDAWYNITGDELFNSAGAFAYYPDPTGSGEFSGDVVVRSDAYSYGTDYFEDLIAHEIGHAIGLAHPRDYSGWEEQYLEAPIHLDDVSNTLMTYSTLSLYDPDYPTTIMPWDIEAVQYLYGYDAFNAGDTTYQYNVTDYIFEAISDTSGIDTLDFSSFSDPVMVSLEPGSWSDLGQDHWVTGGFGDRNLFIPDNVYIENLIGGHGSDTLVGNAFDNILIGGEGVDTLIGGDGQDTAVFSGSFGEYHLSEESVDGVEYLPIV